MASHFKKKEGWWGVAVTLLLCGGFLWWWFQPAPVDAKLERDPLYWLELARKELGAESPSASACLESVVVALGYQQGGKPAVATAIAKDWLPPEWARALAAPAGTTGTNATVAPPDAALAPVLAKLAEARTSLDQLEIERGRAVFREAVAMAEALVGSQKIESLWLVAAGQARSGFAPDAKQTRQRLLTAGDSRSLPAWLIIEFIHADMTAPVLAWIERHPAEASPVLAEMVAVLGERLLHRDAGELAAYGPLADPTFIHPAAEESMLRIHQSVETNQLRAAGEMARQFSRGPARAAAYLVIARTLAWNTEASTR